MKILIATLVYVTLHFTCVLASKDCDTPADCYIKAIAILENDRAEMRRQMDSYEKKLEEANKKYQESLKQVESDFENKHQQCQNQISSLNQQLMNEVDSVRRSILHNLECASSHAGGRWVGCPGGFKAVSCSCGSACGSWTIDHGNNSCNCHCGEWAEVVCCRLTQ